jgi:glutamate-1-semialdehyde 2,1-aminomutase
MTARTIDRARVAALMAREEARYTQAHQGSRELHARGARSLLNGVPMNWMEKWPGPFPLFMSRATGARLWDVDRNEYVDFCLGDTGAMAGHAPTATAEAVAAQMRQGATTILPTADAVWVGEELTHRFGLPIWQIAMSATDANRFALRLAREVTGRPKVLVFNWCYHGTVEETLAVLVNGQVVRRPGVIGSVQDPAETTRVVEFNDVNALQDALSHRDVACVLTEPALTNIGIIPPEPGFHAALRDLTRSSGTLLVIDETHTLCAGPGGMTKAAGLSPDLLVAGKSIGGGVPVAVFGMTKAVANSVAEAVKEPGLNISGIGGTLSGNALAVAAIRATLESRLTEADFARMIPLARRWVLGVQATIDSAGLDWSVSQLGARAEYWLCPRPKTAAEAAAAADDEVESLLHLYALNRGVLLTPFHNMALMSPATSAEDVDRHTEVFSDAVNELARP